MFILYICGILQLLINHGYVMRSVLARIFRYKSRKYNANIHRTELPFLLDRAKQFAVNGNTHALEDMQRLIMRPIQSLHMVDAYLKERHKAVSGFLEWSDFGIGYIPSLAKTFIELAHCNRFEKNCLPIAKLGRDIVLPTCWSHTSMMKLGSIGEGRNRKDSSWTQDINHKLHYWYPMNIFWVDGGNHSITQGILIAEGMVTAIEGYDLSELYSYVRFDGEYWVDSVSGESIGTPRYKELGYVYEIGRYIIDMHHRD